ncbi:MAG: cupin [Actinobacteria bacterium 13_2_20CM_2_71_6]|nr:MAG: cupin [Actinobacteria bacterium 13_2_20CM_2_71_6]
MIVTTAAHARTTETPNAVMTCLAAPSLGCVELSSWRVEMRAGAEGPPHGIDREQVWMPVTGSFAITVDGRTVVLTPGDAAVLPAGVVRQIRVAEGPAEALVCMPVGGQATLPDSGERRRLPWAE